ncbi:hypothetical protein N337_08275, partial [Phoenicopterus ruber ruber]
NSTVKYCNARLLPLIFGRLNPAHSVIANPSHQDPSAKQTGQNLCQKGWICYKGRCYLLKRVTPTVSHLLCLTSFTVQKTCWTERAGGHLISITSADENEFLCKLAQGQKETQFWMGGTFLKRSDAPLTTFIQRPLLSLFRAVGGLVNSPFNIKICLALSRGEWDGSPCSKRLPFICIYKPKLM